MTRKKKILSIIAASIAGLILLVIIAALVVVQTPWFRNFVRDKIISTTEESTGGRVELARFDFNPWRLEATLDGFVLHGTEPASAPPLFQARRIQLGLSLFSGLKKIIDLRYLTVDEPKANVIVAEDGTTNVPSPKVKKKSDKTGLETVVDLAIGDYEFRNGTVLFADKKLPLDARGENLRLSLGYNAVANTYSGNLAMQPLTAEFAANQPLRLALAIPLTLGKDRIAFDNAKIVTANSRITANGVVDHLVSPHISGKANLDVSLHDIEKVASVTVSPEAGKTLPGKITGDVGFAMADGRIDLSGLNLALGQTTIKASGLLQDPTGNDPVDFHAHLALGQLGRIFQLKQKPEGTVNVNGQASLGTAGIRITGKVNGDNLSIAQGEKRYSNITVNSGFTYTPKQVQLSGMDVRALGGRLTGDASLQHMSNLEFKGNLQNFDLNTLYHTFTGKSLGYNGVVSGPVTVSGNLKAPGTKGLKANADLSIVPGTGGVPVSGSLHAKYNGATDNVEITSSNIRLPHSRLELSGNLGQQLNLNFHSTDLNDFLPAMQATSKEPVKEMPVKLRAGGAVNFNGILSGKLSSPNITGHLSANNVNVQGRDFDQLSADLVANAQGATLQNATIRRGSMEIQANAKIGLKNWKPLPEQQLNLNTTIRNGDVADLLALAGQPNVPITGTVNAEVHLTGTVGNPAGSAHALISNGVAYDQPFQLADATIAFTNQKITLSSANIVTPAGAAHLAGTFTHPPDSFTTGQIQAQMQTDRLALGQLQAVNKYVPGLAGTLETSAQVAADLNKVNGQTQFMLTSVNGDLNVRSLQAQGENYGDLSATARTAGSVVSYHVNSNLASSAIRANGETTLAAGYPTSASANVERLPIGRVLTLAGKGNLPVEGLLTGNLQFKGTMDNPNASLDVNIANAVIYGEPLDRLGLKASYTNRTIEVPRLEIADGPARIDGSLTYTHAPGDLQDGQAQFQLTTTDVRLAQLKTVEKYRPGLEGTLRMVANGAATIRKQAGSTQVQLTKLDGNIDLTGLGMNGTTMGDLRLAAQTAGNRLNFNLNSDLAGAKIAGKGQTTLTADYPTNAQLQFANVTYSGLRPLLSPSEVGAPLVDVASDGQIEVDGSVTDLNALTAKLTVSRLQVTSTPVAAAPQQVALHNEGPIVIAMNRGVVRVQQARITGPDTLIAVSGTATLTGAQPLDLSLNANTNLSILQEMSRSIYSSGAIIAKANIRGSVSRPELNGRLELQDASLNYIDFPNGLSKANGVILFNGSNATIQSLTAESGGGKVSASGFVSYGGPVLRYGLQATASGTRVRYPPGASIVADAKVGLTGTSRRSLLSGTVTLQKIGFAPRSDFGSLLSRTSAPAQVPAAPSGPLAGMRLDIAIHTAPDVSFQTSLAQNLQATADLQVRGTATSPGMLGRVNITEGELVFFGSKYTVNQGSINFFDPNRIRPVLNIDLQTVAKGVTVVLNVTGPMDNLKLTHRSDPPLQFNEIVALLATGRTPTSDPNLVAQQPATPPQSLSQIGESAIVSQAIANPLSNRLARVFGVSKLKIDPTFVSGSELPQARLTLQQQISSNITFTYVTNLNQTNSQIIRVEWAFSPQWSAVATREENGRFGVDFFYKRSFR